MAGFESVAAVGNSLENLLNAAYLAGQPVDEDTHAVLIHTEDLAFDTQSRLSRPALSILLYRVDLNKTTRASWSSIGQVEGRSHLPLDLHYLLTAWADNPEEEHRIIGRTLQAIESVGALSGPLLHPSGQWEGGESVQLYLEDMTTEDLMRTFDSLACDFRLSIPYLARIVVVTGGGNPVPPAVHTVVDALTPAGAVP